MLLKISAIIGSVVAFLAALLFARRDGAKSEKLEQLRKEIEREAKERERAQNIIDNVRNMSDDDVSKRLQDISSK